MTTWREIREMAEDIRRRTDESVTATDIGAKAVALATEAYEALLVDLHREMRAGRGEAELAETLRVEMDHLWYALGDEEHALFDELSEDLYVIEDKRNIVPLAEGETVELVDQQMRLAYEANDDRRALALVRKLPGIDAAIAHTMGRCWERLGFVTASACFDAFASELVSKPPAAAPRTGPSAPGTAAAPTKPIALSEDQAERAVEEILQRAREVAEGNGESKFTGPWRVREHVPLPSGFVVLEERVGYPGYRVRAERSAADIFTATLVLERFIDSYFGLRSK